MRTICPQCAEPLLGSVNRCWRCGLSIDTGRSEDLTAPAPSTVDHPVAAPGGGHAAASAMAQREYLARSGYSAAFVLALLASVAYAVGDRPLLGLLLAVAGTVLALWGLLARVRWPALAALILCLGVLVWCGTGAIRRAIQQAQEAEEAAQYSADDVGP